MCHDVSPQALTRPRDRGNLNGVFPKPTGGGDIVTLVGGATLTTADGLGGARKHAGLSADANHKVNGSLTSAAPVPTSAEVTGTSLIIRFNKALAPAASLSKDSFKVSVNGTDRLINRAEIHPTVETAVLMTLPLGSPVAGTDTVKVSYARPTSGSNNRLKDAAGNEVKSFTDFKVTNLDDTTAPTFQSATVNETALVITFNDSLAAAASLANSAFAVKKTPSGQAEEAVSLSGSPSISGATVTLTLAAAVRGTDTGVKVSYTPPTTGTDNKLADENGNEVASFTDRTVTNETDATPPTFESATVNRAALVITFNEPLAAAASLASSAFTVKKTPSEQAEQAVSLSGSPSISGATVTLTLAVAAAETDTNVKVSYARPASGTANKLADENGNEVASFTDKAVTNETDITPPTPVRATVNGDTVTITFDEELDEDVSDSLPTARFGYKINGGSPAFPSGVSLSGRNALVTLASAVTDRDTVWLSYQSSGDTSKLQDASGNAVAPFTFDPVTNLTPDTTVPQFQSATVNGTLLSVTFDEALDTSSAPPGSAFTLLEEDLTEHAGGSGDASIDGMTVTVTLTQAAAPAETYAVEYEQPAVAGQRLKDATGNEVATFSGSVTNNTPLPWPVATGATVNGKTLTIAFDKDLDTAQAPAANRFRYTREGETDFHNPESVAMAARTVTLTLRHTVSFREAITVRYLSPASGGLRGTDGHVTRDFALDTVTNETPDTTPPQPVEAYTNPQGVVIRFNEDLVTNNLSKTDFTVKVDGAVRAQTAKPLPAGDQLLLRFSPAIVHGETATVSYGGGTGLKDARLNLVQPFTDFPVENRVAAPAGPASISSVAITSTPSLDANGDGTPDTYRQGEKIEVTVTWDKAVSWDVSVSGTDIRVRLDVGGETKAADLARGGATTGTARSLKFRYRVQAADGDTDGVFPTPNAAGDLVLLVGAATLAAAGGESAQVAHAALAANANHKVDGAQVDTTAPTLSSTVLAGDELTLTYDERLDETSVPTTDRFAVLVDGEARDIDSVSIDGAALTLSLASAVTPGKTVRLTYGAQNADRHQDLAGNPAPAISNRSVSNPDRAPQFVSATVNGRTLKVTFDEAPSTSHVPRGGRFIVRHSLDDSRRIIGHNVNTSIDGMTVTATLNKPAVAGQSYTVGYVDRSESFYGPHLQDAAGNRVAAFRDKPVTNETPFSDVTVESAALVGTTLTVTFSEAVSTSGQPAADETYRALRHAFLVIGTIDGHYQVPDTVTVGGATVTLELGAVLAGDRKVALSYYPEDTDDPLLDAAGAAVPHFADQPVDYATGGRPVLERAEVVARGSDQGQTTLRLTFDEALDGASLPAGSAFRVHVSDPKTETQTVIRGTGTASVLEAEVEVTLSAGVDQKAGVTVSYETPDTNPLQDGEGNAVADFERRQVAIIDRQPPVYASGSVTGRRVTLNFDEPLDTTDTVRWPVPSDFAVTVGDSPRGVETVALTGSTVTLTLASATTGGESVKASYTRGQYPIRDLAGNEAADFTDKTLTNVGTSDPGAPTVATAVADGTQVTLTFTQSLDASSTPAPEAFGLWHPVTADDGLTTRARAVQGVSVAGADVVLDLNGQVYPCDSFEVRYAKPDTNALRNLFGTEVEDFPQLLTNARAGLCGTDWQYSNGSVSGDGLLMKMGRQLQGNAELPGRSFLVKAAPPVGSPRTIEGTGMARIAGETVGVTLASAVAADEALTVSYRRPRGEAGVMDASGRQLADFSDVPVRNGAPGAADAATVTNVEVVSDAGEDRTYALGERIRIGVTFSAAVDVTGAPRLKIDMDPADWGEKWAGYQRGGGTATLTFVHEVVEPNVSRQGIAVLADTLELNGGTIKEAGGDADAALAHDGLGHDPNHKVNWQLTNEPSPARFESAETEEAGRGVILTFTKEILHGGRHTSYTVQVDGERRTTRGAFWEENTVSLVLAEPVRWGETVTVAYAKTPGGAMLHDVDELAIESFGPEAVANTVPNPENTAATGAPTIAGTARVGETLTAETSEIADADGLTGAAFAYQWLSNDADIADATGASYTLADADEGAAVKVRVTFTDDAGNEETLTSAATEAVAPPLPPLTASFVDVPAEHEGAGVEFSFELRFSEDFGGRLPYKKLRDEALRATNGRVVGAARVASNQNQRWTIRVRPRSVGEVTVSLPATTDCGAAGAICTPDGRPLSNATSATVAGPPNRPATGAPTIAGTARVGETLTAETADIADADGLSGAAFSYQWLSNDADIAGATGDSYTLADADEGARVKVRVTFTDDVGHEETLTSAATETVAPPLPPLTASFVDVPAEHGGQGVEFSFELRFSEDFPGRLPYKKLKEHALQATNGRVVGAARMASNQNQRWTIRVRPHSAEEVTVSLPATSDCGAAGGICTPDGRRLSNANRATVIGPVGISVADARVEEGAGAVLAFAVTLSRAATSALTVDYATADGSARAGEDYTAASGTLSFPAGETSASVEVGVLDDAHDEGEETLTLRLSNASGGVLADGEATGTIENKDLMPAALLARIGRATAEQVVTHIEERLAAPRQRGFRARFAGREFQPGSERDFALGFLSSFTQPMGIGPAGAAPMGGAAMGAAPMGGGAIGGGAPMGMGPHTAGAGGRGAGMPGAMSMPGMGGGSGMGMGGMTGATGMAGRPPPMGGGSVADAHETGLFNTMVGHDPLSNSEFELNREARGGTLSLWSRNSRSHFSGIEDALSLNGDVRTSMFGADWARGPLTVGLSVGRTLGLGGYSGPSSGQMTTSMTGFYPWAGYQVNDKVSVWGATGYGTGMLSLTPGSAAALETGVSMAMTAVGTRGELVGSRATGGFSLAFKTDALWVGAASELLDGPTGRLNASEAGVTRVRAALEGSRGFTLGGRLSLRPSVEVGLRRDGGDAETGAGMDVGGGLAFADTVTGLSLDVRVRTLVVHQAEGFSDRGMSLSFGWDPTPSSPLGLTAKVAPTWGGQARGGAEALWGNQMAYGMGSHQMHGAGGRVDAEVGYGLPMGARLVGTPRVGLTTSPHGRDYRFGYGLGVLEQGSVSFELGVDAQRRETPEQGEASNGLLGRAAVGW